MEIQTELCDKISGMSSLLKLTFVMRHGLLQEILMIFFVHRKRKGDLTVPKAHSRISGRSSQKEIFLTCNTPEIHFPGVANAESILCDAGLIVRWLTAYGRRTIQQPDANIYPTKDLTTSRLFLTSSLRGKREKVYLDMIAGLKIMPKLRSWFQKHGRIWQGLLLAK